MAICMSDAVETCRGYASISTVVVGTNTPIAVGSGAISLRAKRTCGTKARAGGGA